MLISASLIKWRVNFRDLNFHYFHPKFSIPSRKQKALFYQGGDPPLLWTLWRKLEEARFLHLIPMFSDNPTNIYGFLHLVLK